MSILSSAELAQYAQDGFLLVPGLFDTEEMDLLQRSAREDRALDQHSQGRQDAQGGTVRLALWNHPGDGIYGMFARSQRLVDRMEALLGGEVYHYHSKMILKDPEVGGAWEWHQDYGYWYHYGCLEPLLASAMIAVDPATEENGCLQVLRGSHHLGRLDHSLIGEQSGADPERVTIAMERLEQVPIQLNPGDAVFFHCNLLHCSGQNRSPRSRWALICCFNAARNNPYKESRHPRYTPLQKVGDDAIKTVGIRRFAESSEVSWMGPREDRTIPPSLTSNVPETV